MFPSTSLEFVHFCQTVHPLRASRELQCLVSPTQLLHKHSNILGYQQQVPFVRFSHSFYLVWKFLSSASVPKTAVALLRRRAFFLNIPPQRCRISPQVSLFLGHIGRHGIVLKH